MFKICLRLPSGHLLFVCGVYHPPKPTYRTRPQTFLQYLVHVADNVLDKHPGMSIVTGGDINQFDPNELCFMTGWYALVNFPNKRWHMLRYYLYKSTKPVWETRSGYYSDRNGSCSCHTNSGDKTETGLPKGPYSWSEETSEGGFWSTRQMQLTSNRKLKSPKSFHVNVCLSQITSSISVKPCRLAGIL